MAAPPSAVRQRASCISMSGLTLLQITKHCQEAMPDIATGVVLGMERKGVLEVTHSFPTPDKSRKDLALDSEGGTALATSSEKVDVPKYTMDMLKQLRDVNVDNNNMGWYRSSQGLGGFLDRKFVEAMMVYYRDNSSSFVIVFDPWFSRKGSLLIKAFRLRPEFYRTYQSQAFSQATFDSLGQSTILEEIPIKISNSPLAKVFLWDLNETLGDEIDCDFDRLNLGANAVDDRGFGRLLAALNGTALARLALGSAELTDAAAAALGAALRAGELPALAHLHLGINSFGPAGAEALARAPWPASLTTSNGRSRWWSSWIFSR